MKIKKTLTHICGALSAGLFLCGLCSFMLGRTFAFTVGIVIACLSLASGLLLPNPISFLTLAVGLCMIFAPVTVSGIVLVTLGAAGMITVPILSSIKGRTADGASS